MRKTFLLSNLFLIVFLLFIFLIPTHSFAESLNLTAEDWLKKALALSWTNPEKAIEYLNNAIKLQPDHAAAYNYRGATYAKLGQHQRAIRTLMRLSVCNRI
jgi:tetratricopeptide (TPR) repeat protein